LGFFCFGLFHSRKVRGAPLLPSNIRLGCKCNLGNGLIVIIGKNILLFKKTENIHFLCDNITRLSGFIIIFFLSFLTKLKLYNAAYLVIQLLLDLNLEESYSIGQNNEK
jgi:hypothetical protein